MANILINGKHLVLNGITGNVGDKNAVATIVVPIAVDDLQTAFSINPKTVAEVLGIDRMTCTDRPISQMEYGGYEIRLQFEGFNQEVSQQQGEEMCSYSFDADMAEEPIQTHPGFEKLRKEYEWKDSEDGDGYFPKELGSSASSSGMSKDNKETAKPNPLHKVENWLKAGGIYTRSYAVSTVPSSIYNGIGTIVDYPPGAAKINIPRFRNRKWLKMAPLIQTGDRGSGSAARITERYRLTGATTGSEAIIYSHGQLED